MLKKIDRNYFNDIILNGKKDIISDGEVKTIPSDSIKEFSVKNKFFYQLSDKSIYKKPQQIIAEFLSKHATSNNSSIAFKAGLCYFDFLKPHLNNSRFLRLDIKSFFHSIDIEMLKKTLSHYIEDDYIDDMKKQKIIDALINIVTIENSEDLNIKIKKGSKFLPIGFTSSPLLSDVFFRKIDIIIQKLCVKHSIQYTRYADDLLFSVSHKNTFINKNWEGFTNEIEKIVNYFRLNINRKKTTIRKGLISLNGYTIETKMLNGAILNSEVRLSNDKLSKLTRTIYHLDTLGSSPKKIINIVFKEKIENIEFKYKATQSFIERHYKFVLMNKLCGYRSFIISILKYNSGKKILNEKSKQKYENIVSTLERLILVL
ncbi:MULTISPECIES: reverse transcriptase domain-containing protein [Serratia]|uniref:reverse transcriptase domain-containing protein n=1 Tax=Serratia TaxID=613 RepID=UPI000745046D|nr:reverse transcriptase domain-containing protein [Serratia marcescens]RNW14905.1 hypothetical protein CAG37_001740 [Serratia nematodiphila]NSM19305.1 hypothetical protein [Serratia marcescens]NSM48290.1 hypothetical protein [Serratia marcescens]CUY05056.1 Retron-type reverse transcriptase [Serratia marcescens]CUY42439.1 Retron-type reverse transcriptase [Serratia marcescens]